MGPIHADVLLRYVRQQVAASSPDTNTDRDLIQRFAAVGDETAFDTLVRRHGPMVLRVCRHVLGNVHDAEDAFQATFLVLARKAGALLWRESVAGWLYRVASRVALKARTAACRRRAHESLANGPPPAAPPVGEITLREARALLNEELNRLPDQLRLPLVLCYLEGMTQDQAARQAGWSLSTLQRRLRRGLDLLRGRLQRRGLELAGVLSLTLLEAGDVSAALLDAVIRRPVVPRGPGGGGGLPGRRPGGRVPENPVLDPAAVCGRSAAGRRPGRGRRAGCPPGLHGQLETGRAGPGGGAARRRGAGRASQGRRTGEAGHFARARFEHHRRRAVPRWQDAGLGRNRFSRGVVGR
jgi:RNA polymerase sigma factor (sigma-70 family)